jgi:hypothetical protein
MTRKFGWEDCAAKVAKGPLNNSDILPAIDLHGWFFSFPPSKKGRRDWNWIGTYAKLKLVKFRHKLKWIHGLLANSSLQL